MAKSNKKKMPPNTIAVNRKARFDYSIEDTLEAGIVLEGWEVKSLRAGKGQIAESFVQLHNDEAWLFNAHISPLLSASSHVKPDPTRKRKLLLHRDQIDRLIGAVDRKGYTIVPLDLHWKAGKAKVTIGYAKGKKLHDKRATQKDRDWERQKGRILKHG
ncbi:MAG: SsrA-binding protein SmpB [Pseudomonadota bacterium]